MRIPALHQKWLEQDEQSRAAVARACKTSRDYFRNLVYGHYPIPERMAPAIEREWGISRRDLRPADWGDIWPELIDAEHPWPPVADAAQGAA